MCGALSALRGGLDAFIQQAVSFRWLSCAWNALVHWDHVGLGSLERECETETDMAKGCPQGEGMGPVAKGSCARKDQDTKV